MSATGGAAGVEGVDTLVSAAVVVVFLLPPPAAAPMMLMSRMIAPITMAMRAPFGISLHRSWALG